MTRPTQRLCLESVNFAYPGATAPSLTDVSLSLEPGSLTLLAGPNGSGKSTLLLLLAGLYAPGQGRILRGEVPARSALLREVSGYLAQDPDAQLLGATVGEDLLLCVERGDVAGKARAQELAARFGLAERWDTAVTTLSHGQKRSVCLAGVLLGKNVELLLWDEPCAGLDYRALIELRTLLAEAKERGLTQLVASHDVEPLVDIADRMALLDGGKLAAEGTPEAVLPACAAHGVRPPCSWLARGVLEPYR